MRIPVLTIGLCFLPSITLSYEYHQNLQRSMTESMNSSLQIREVLVKEFDACLQTDDHQALLPILQKIHEQQEAMKYSSYGASDPYDGMDNRQLLKQYIDRIKRYEQAPDKATDQLICQNIREFDYMLSNDTHASWFNSYCDLQGKPGLRRWFWEKSFELAWRCGLCLPSVEKLIFIRTYHQQGIFKNWAESRTISVCYPANPDKRCNGTILDELIEITARKGCFKIPRVLLRDLTALLVNSCPSAQLAHTFLGEKNYTTGHYLIDWYTRINQDLAKLPKQDPTSLSKKEYRKACLRTIFSILCDHAKQKKNNPALELIGDYANKQKSPLLRVIMPFLPRSPNLLNSVVIKNHF